MLMGSAHPPSFYFDEMLQGDPSNKENTCNRVLDFNVVCKDIMTVSNCAKSLVEKNFTINFVLFKVVFNSIFHVVKGLPAII